MNFAFLSPALSSLYQKVVPAAGTIEKKKESKEKSIIPVKKERSSIPLNISLQRTIEDHIYKPSKRTKVISDIPQFGLDQFIHQPGRQRNPGVMLDSEFASVGQRTFVMLIVGKPGSGKTYMIEEMLINPKFYGSRFDEIFVYSPYPLPTIKEKWFPQFTVDAITDLVQSIAKQNPTANVLFILDDCISIIRENASNPKLNALFYNAGNLIPKGTISFMITTQKYNRFPASLRSILTSVMLFPLLKLDWRIIVNEHTFIDPSDLFYMQVCEHWKQNSHNFIFANLSTGKIFANFSQVLAS